MDKPFSGKKVFVSGGTSGINLAIAEAFAAAGATLGVMSRSADKVAAARESISRHGAACEGYAADVRDPAAVEAALRAFNAAHGGINVLVNGAAGNFVAPALGMSPNGFRTVVEIDLLGTFHVLHAAHPFLAKPGASVVNISASQAQTPMMMQSHVCAAKAGADMLIRTLALEWARDGIRLNSIAPGPVADTEGMARLAPTPEAERATRSRIPLGRYSHKEEIAAIALFLCSDAAAMITGQVLTVDGGLNLGRYGPELAAQMDGIMAERAKGR